MRLSRVFKHLATPHWAAARAFAPPVLGKIAEAVRASERHHGGELRFAIEGALPLHSLKTTTRQRAEALFAQLRVWDTEHNNGVLIYVQLVDRRIEIVADRGIAAKVEPAEWNAACRGMEVSFAKQEFLQGALEAIQAITQILARHFPPHGRKPNELPDKPVVL
jgi:uncharacterized membrane protein